jgi:uncharacterized protein
MFGLIPKEEKFFIMFQEMSKKIVEGARLLKEMLDNYDVPSEHKKKIKEIEHQGDQITHSIIKKLDKAFITPFDREDIYSLASSLDDILDVIDTSAQHLITYGIDKITPEAKQIGFIIYESCEAIDKALSQIGGTLAHISEYCIKINSYENEADKVRTDAVFNLFQQEKDPIQIIKWKDIYEHLELVTDKCEDVANVLESILLKNA